MHCIWYICFFIVVSSVSEIWRGPVIEAAVVFVSHTPPANAKSDQLQHFPAKLKSESPHQCQAVNAGIESSLTGRTMCRSLTRCPCMVKGENTSKWQTYALPIIISILYLMQSTGSFEQTILIWIFYRLKGPYSIRPTTAISAHAHHRTSKRIIIWLNQ